MFYFTIPNLNTWPKRIWPITFTISVLYILGWCYLMIVNSVKIACILGISASAIGLTAVAAGTSFPNLLGSLYAARRGLGKDIHHSVFIYRLSILLFIQMMFYPFDY